MQRKLIELGSSEILPINGEIHVGVPAKFVKVIDECKIYRY